jgi:hypothetical protein
MIRGSDGIWRIEGMTTVCSEIYLKATCLTVGHPRPRKKNLLRMPVVALISNFCSEHHCSCCWVAARVCNWGPIDGVVLDATNQQQ